jgi:hypothetical protein
MITQTYNPYSEELIKRFLTDIQDFSENKHIYKVLYVDVSKSYSASVVMVNKGNNGSYNLRVYKVVDYFTLDLIYEMTYIINFEELEKLMLSKDFYNVLNWGKEWY